MLDFFDYRSCRFAYRSYDSGPAIIFLHGFLENQSMWQDVIKSLPHSYRKITLDLPGHGNSENLGYLHSMEEMAKVIEALMNHLRLKKAFLMGHSLGGYAALAFGEKHPEKVRGMVLMNYTAKADSDEKKVMRDKTIALVKISHKPYIRQAIPNLFRTKNRRNLSEKVNWAKEEALNTSKQGIIAALEGMKIRPDREVLLHFAPYNFLFVALPHDPILPWESLEDQLKAHRVTPLITEGGHMAHLEDFDLLTSSLKKFLKENL